jgi:hypothetical protein
MCILLYAPNVKSGASSKSLCLLKPVLLKKVENIYSDTGIANHAVTDTFRVSSALFARQFISYIENIKTYIDVYSKRMPPHYI